MFKVNAKNTRMTPCSGTFNVSFEHMHFSNVFIVDSEEANAS